MYDSLSAQVPLAIACVLQDVAPSVMQKEEYDTRCGISQARRTRASPPYMRRGANPLGEEASRNLLSAQTSLAIACVLQDVAPSVIRLVQAFMSINSLCSRSQCFNTCVAVVLFVYCMCCVSK